ncbi:MAG: hypothetical protein AAGC93_25675 [Cyanobacteria bacterium P01_F01_bin.53]
MLKKTLAFGLLAASTIGMAVPAHAQNVVSGSQSIDSQTVGVNGSNVTSVNDQDLQQVLVDSDFGNFGTFPQPNIVTGDQDIDSATVGANGSNVVSVNDQDQTNVLIDNDAYNYGYGYYGGYDGYPATYPAN